MLAHIVCFRAVQWYCGRVYVGNFFAAPGLFVSERSSNKTQQIVAIKTSTRPSSTSRRTIYYQRILSHSNCAAGQVLADIVNDIHVNQDPFLIYHLTWQRTERIQVYVTYVPSALIGSERFRLSCYYISQSVEAMRPHVKIYTSLGNFTDGFRGQLQMTIRSMYTLHKSHEFDRLKTLVNLTMKFSMNSCVGDFIHFEKICHLQVNAVYLFCQYIRAWS